MLAATLVAQAQHVTEFVPASGKGSIVVVVSGISGPPKYHAFSSAMADAGYYTLLVDGAQTWRGADKAIRGLVARAQASPHALPGKAAVVGLSLGGAVVLRYAAQAPDVVYAGVAFYPATDRIADEDVALIRVPTLMLAAVHDTFSSVMRSSFGGSL